MRGLRGLRGSYIVCCVAVPKNLPSLRYGPAEPPDGPESETAHDAGIKIARLQK